MRPPCFPRAVFPDPHRATKTSNRPSPSPAHPGPYTWVPPAPFPCVCPIFPRLGLPQNLSHRALGWGANPGVQQEESQALHQPGSVMGWAMPRGWDVVGGLSLGLPRGRGQTPMAPPGSHRAPPGPKRGSHRGRRGLSVPQGCWCLAQWGQRLH